MTHPSTPRFTTPRLVAGHWSLDHAEAAFAMYGDPQTTRFLWGTPDRTVEETRERLRGVVERNAGFDGRRGSWPLLRREDGELIGTAILKPFVDSEGHAAEEVEIGWHVRRDQWGRGYATEAGRALLAYGFDEEDLPVLHAVVVPENLASRRVARRLGMEEVGLTRKYYAGKELVLHRLEREQFRRRESPTTPSS